MSYIVNRTDFNDPAIAIYNMDLQDLFQIYQSKIQNYFGSQQQAIKFYKWNDEDIEEKELIDDINNIIRIICFQFLDQNMISCPILFAYFTCLTNDWSLPINFEEELINFSTLTIKEIRAVLNQYNSINFPALRKYIENVQNNSTEILADTIRDENGMIKDISDFDLLDWFLLFFKNDCNITVIFENKIVTTSSFEGFSQEQLERAKRLKQIREEEIQNANRLDSN